MPDLPRCPDCEGSGEHEYCTLAPHGGCHEFSSRCHWRAEECENCAGGGRTPKEAVCEYCYGRVYSAELTATDDGYYCAECLAANPDVEIDGRSYLVGIARAVLGVAS